MTFPQTYGPNDVPPSVQTLIEALLPQLLHGGEIALQVKCAAPGHQEDQ